MKCDRITSGIATIPRPPCSRKIALGAAAPAAKDGRRLLGNQAGIATSLHLDSFELNARAASSIELALGIRIPQPAGVCGFRHPLRRRLRWNRGTGSIHFRSLREEWKTAPLRGVSRLAATAPRYNHPACLPGLRQCLAASSAQSPGRTACLRLAKARSSSSLLMKREANTMPKMPVPNYNTDADQLCSFAPGVCR